MAVLEVGCLDICPKRAVVMVKASEPATVMLVPEGTGTAEVVRRLELRGRSPDGSEGPRQAGIGGRA